MIALLAALTMRTFRAVAGLLAVGPAPMAALAALVMTLLMPAFRRAPDLVEDGFGLRWGSGCASMLVLRRSVLGRGILGGRLLNRGLAGRGIRFGSGRRVLGRRCF
ncbi:hypothetical protein [Methyloceanibacter stevinii]|uniref:hypothetical protein n=1 Tax=Methyloceanibacter stevinii TaxID=1774970 RepID=UPI001FCDC12F|nr:hypothetical protein [Methyloceanibacter stevinii]